MSIKFIHTSDWHLGKKLFNIDRTSEQEDFLNWLSSIIIENRPTALIISGDIFDTQNPPSEALKIYFRFLKTVTEKSDTQIIIIAGNHDNGKFLEAPSPFLEKNNVTVLGKIPDYNPEKDIDEYIKQQTIQFKDSIICLLPFFRIRDLQKLPWWQECEDIADSVTQTVERHIKILTDQYLEKNIILVSHHSYGLFEESASEHSLVMSGRSSLPLSIIPKEVDYMALGHLHKAQIVNKTAPMAIYPGSPIPFRFSESNLKKICLVEIDKKQVKQNWIEVPSTRKLLKVRISSDDWKDELSREISKNLNDNREFKYNALIDLTIILKKPKIGLIDEIKEFLSELNITALSIQTHIDDHNNHSKREYNPSLLSLSTENLFKKYYQTLFNIDDKTEIPEEVLESFEKILSLNRESIDGELNASS